MLTIDCEKCGQEFDMAMDETIIYVFDEVEYNYISTTCEHCLTKMILFFGDPALLQYGYPIVHQPEAPAHIRQRRLRLDQHQKELSADELLDEYEVGKFHDWLENIEPFDFNWPSTAP